MLLPCFPEPIATQTRSLLQSCPALSFAWKANVQLFHASKTCYASLGFEAALLNTIKLFVDVDGNIEVSAKGRWR